MVIFLPAPRNIRLLKSILMDDFALRSAHASEAIAALIGFGSHAALKARGGAAVHARVYETDFAAFETRAARVGYPEAACEHLRTIYGEIEWPDPAWKLIGKRNLGDSDAWFAECQRRKIPFLYVAKARKYCSVHWDHVSMDTSYDADIHHAYKDELGEILFRTYRLITAGAEPKSRFDGSASVGEITGLSYASARQIANAFAALLFPGNLAGALPVGT